MSNYFFGNSRNLFFELNELKMGKIEEVENSDDDSETIVKSGNYAIHKLKSHIDYVPWQNSVKLVLSAMSANHMIAEDFELMTDGEIIKMIKQGNPALNAVTDENISLHLIREKRNEENKVHVKAMMAIKQSVNPALKSLIRNCTTAKEMWQTIDASFKNTDAYEQALLKKEENHTDMNFKYDSAKGVYYEMMSACIDRYIEKWSRMKQLNCEPSNNDKANRIKDILWHVHHMKALEIRDKLDVDGTKYSVKEIDDLVKFIKKYDYDKINVPPYHSKIEKRKDPKEKEANYVKNDKSNHRNSHANGNSNSSTEDKSECEICTRYKFTSCVLCNICKGHGHLARDCTLSHRHQTSGNDHGGRRYDSRNKDYGSRRYDSRNNDNRRGRNDGINHRRNYRKSDRNERDRSRNRTPIDGYESEKSIHSIKSNESRGRDRKRYDRNRSRSRSNNRNTSRNRSFNRNDKEKGRENDKKKQVSVVVRNRNSDDYVYFNQDFEVERSGLE